MFARDLYPTAWQQAISMLQRNPQALLINGREGLGKSGFALELTHWLLCEHTPQSSIDNTNTPSVYTPCGHCTSCRLMTERQHPDFRWIMPGAKWSDLYPWWGNKSAPDSVATQQIRMVDIQNLSDFIHLSSVRGGRRVVVIWPAQTMNRHAANALLKALEEPERDLVFLLVADHQERMPSTILSRCRELFISPPPFDLAQRWITEQHTKQASSPETHGPEALNHVLSLAAGAPMRALRWFAHHHLLEDVAKATMSETRGNNMMALAVRMDDSIKQKASSTIKPQLNKSKRQTKNAKIAQETTSLPIEPHMLNLDDWLDILQRLLTNQFCHHLKLPSPYAHIVQTRTSIASSEKFFHLMDELVYFRRHLIFTLNPRQVFERILLQVAQLNQLSEK